MFRSKCEILLRMLRYLYMKLLPIKRGRIVFTSFEGHYSDSPKCICSSLHNKCRNAEIVWLVDKERIISVPDYAKAVDIKSVKAVKYIGTAHILVDNVYAGKATELDEDTFKARTLFKIFSFLKKKRGQLAFTTWHGTPLKRMGIDQHGSTQVDFSCYNEYMILDNRFTADIMERLTFGRIKIEMLGCPRNDILHEPDQSLIAETKHKLGIPEKKKILLYAPTFRSDKGNTTDINIRRSGLDQIEDMDFDRLFEVLNKKFGGDWVIIFRCHYFVERIMDFEKLNSKAGNRLINGNLSDDMSEYLLCSDILITDASSCMFDYSLMLRPCFLFFPDMDYYKSSERGLYIPYEHLPFAISDTFDGLLDNISAFDDAEYQDRVAELHCRLGYFSEGCASDRAADFIIETSGLNE